MDPSVGVTLGKYQLVATIGRGGMADVFLALARGEMGFTKLVVLKCMRVTEQEKAFTSMFFDEVRLAARLSHPNIVTTFDGGDASGTYFLAMEFLEGQPLDQVWRAWSGPYQPHPRVWALVMGEAMAGLSYAHALKDFDGKPLQVVHRDVSPQNIFLTYDGAVKLMDFGIAKATSNSTQTDAGMLKGKLRYMSPEQFGGRPIDHRSDLFSAGVVLWELVANQRMVEGDFAQVMHRLLSAEPLPRLSSVVTDISPRLDDLVARALEKDPGKRFQNASEMRAELLAFVRSTGALDPSELGRALLQTFSEHREQVRAQVEAHVLKASNAHTVRDLGSVRLGAGLDTPAVGTPRPSGPPVPLGAEATRLAAAQALPAPLPPEESPEGTVLGQSAPAGAGPGASGRWRVPVAVGAAVLAVGALVAIVLAPSRTPEPAPVPVPAPAPVAVATPPPPPTPKEQPGSEAPAPAPEPPVVKAEPPVVKAEPPVVKAEPVPVARAAPAPAAPPAAAVALPRPSAAESHQVTVAALAPAPRPAPVAVATHPDLPTAKAEPSPEPRPAPTPVVTAVAAPPPPRAPEVDPAPVLKPEAHLPVSGGVSKAALRQVVAANREHIQECYDHATMDGRPIRGQVTLNFEVAGAGTVSQVSETSTILERGAQLEHCLLDTARAWKFPPTGDGAPAQTSYTFTFGKDQ